jgi:hypothetical protein
MSKKGKKTNEEDLEKNKTAGEETEETEKEGGTLSDGVLDAFDEVAPTDPLVEEDPFLNEEDEIEDLDSGDYSPEDEW